MMKKLSLALGLFWLSFSAHALFLQNCSNLASPSQPVSYFFTSCVNNNFNAIDRELEQPVFFNYCSNFGNRVDYFFISCINSNFRTAENALRAQNIFLSHCSNFRDNELDYFFVSCVNRNFSEIERAVR